MRLINGLERIKGMRLINGLERMIGERAREKLVKNRAYGWVADGAAVNLFSLSFMASEMTLGGMNFWESLSTRAAAFVGNYIVGPPYCMVRDRVMKGLNIKKETTRWIRWPVEMATFAVGQTPFYVGFLMVGNMIPDIVQGIANGDLDTIANSYQQINWGGVRRAAATLTMLAPLIGPGQGWTCDRVREQFGLKTAYDKAEREPKKDI